MKPLLLPFSSQNGSDRGRLEARTFLKSFEDLKEQYDPNHKTTFAGLRDSLPGAAKEWFLAYQYQFESYDQFKLEFLKEFLPSDYEMVLRGQIRNENQTDRERFSTFQAKIRRMNSYLQSPLSEEDILEQLLLKSHKRYKLQFNLLENKNIGNLMRIAKAIENTQEFMDAESSVKFEINPRKTLSAACNRSNETTSRPCLNCHQPGHHYKQCELPIVIRCYFCGTKGKTINSCDCRRKTVASTKIIAHENSPLSGETPVKECWSPEN